jgi:hypothetical protein
LVLHLDHRWYTSFVPTTRPRHQVTETPDIAAALDLAAKQWPGEPRARLLVRLVTLGQTTLQRDQDAARRARLAAIEETSGKYSDAFPPGYLAELRQDWPE